MPVRVADADTDELRFVLSASRGMRDAHVTMAFPYGWSTPTRTNCGFVLSASRGMPKLR